MRVRIPCLSHDQHPLQTLVRAWLRTSCGRRRDKDKDRERARRAADVCSRRRRRGVAVASQVSLTLESLGRFQDLVIRKDLGVPHDPPTPNDPVLVHEEKGSPRVLTARTQDTVTLRDLEIGRVAQEWVRQLQ